MTHLFKRTEVWHFDMPAQRIMDVYGKNASVHLELYIKYHIPKVTKVSFDEKYPGVNVEIEVPKYPKEHPYFSNEDRNLLLKVYMDYANMTRDELLDWAASLRKKGDD